MGRKVEEGTCGPAALSTLHSLYSLLENIQQKLVSNKLEGFKTILNTDT